MIQQQNCSQKLQLPRTSFKKKIMRLPILSLQNDRPYMQIKNKLNFSERKDTSHSKQQKRSISQLLNIIESPEPFQRVIFKKTAKKKTLSSHRELQNMSDLSGKRQRKRSEELIKSLKTHFQEAVHKLVEVKREIPKIQSLKAYIQKQSAIKQSLKQQAKNYINTQLDFEGQDLTVRKVKISSIHCHPRPFAYQSLESSLLRKDYIKKEVKNSMRDGRKQVNKKTKADRSGEFSGWKSMERYMPWEEEEVGLVLEDEDLSE